jgi:hypothetical protein
VMAGKCVGICMFLIGRGRGRRRRCVGGFRRGI